MIHSVPIYHCCVIWYVWCVESDAVAEWSLAAAPDSDNDGESIGRRVAAAPAPPGRGGGFYYHVKHIKCPSKCRFKRKCNALIWSGRRIALPSLVGMDLQWPDHGNFRKNSLLHNILH